MDDEILIGLLDKIESEILYETNQDDLNASKVTDLINLYILVLRFMNGEYY